MNKVQAIEFIAALERRYPVVDWTMNGVHVWPLARVDLYRRLFSEAPRPISFRIYRYPWRVARRLLKFFDGISRDQTSNQSPCMRADAVFVASSTTRQQLLDGCFHDRQCGPVMKLATEQGLSVLHWEYERVGDYRLPRATPSAFIQPYLDWQAFLFRVLPDGIVNCHLPNAVELSREVSNKLNGVQIDWEALLRRRLSLVLRYAGLFERWLCKVQPRLVFCSYYYGAVGMALMLACRRLGITAVDIQHGVQGNFHVAYGRWSAVPKDGYELLPDGFWVWSPAEAEAITAWSEKLPRHRPYVAGNLWLESWRQPNELMRSYDRLLGDFLQERKAAATILVTLQPDLDRREELDWLSALMAKAPKSWLWLVRLHPNMRGLQETVDVELRRDGHENFEVARATEWPLLAWMRQVQVHMTSSSSSVLEAEQFGVPSVVWSEMGRQLYAAQIASGTACFLRDPTAIVEKLSKWIGRQGGASRPVPTSNGADVLRELLDQSSRSLRVTQYKEM